jgi:hypothetical protein
MLGSDDDFTCEFAENLGTLGFSLTFLVHDVLGVRMA